MPPPAVGPTYRIKRTSPMTGHVERRNAFEHLERPAQDQRERFVGIRGISGVFIAVVGMSRKS